MVAITAQRCGDGGADAGALAGPLGGDPMTSAGAADDPAYFAPEESSKALYSALTDALQADIDLRLGRPMGTFEQPQPRRAEAWRSGRSLRNVERVAGDAAQLCARTCSGRRSLRWRDRR